MVKSFLAKNNNKAVKKLSSKTYAPDITLVMASAQVIDKLQFGATAFDPNFYCQDIYCVNITAYDSIAFFFCAITNSLLVFTR